MHIIVAVHADIENVAMAELALALRRPMFWVCKEKKMRDFLASAIHNGDDI
jgi:hypothetical protein